MNPLDFIAAVFAVYAATTVITRGYIAKGFRQRFRRFVWRWFPRSMAEHMVKWEMPIPILPGSMPRPVLDDDDDLDLSYERDIKGFCFISCPLCCGFWIALTLCIWFVPFIWIPGIYGGSFFLSTQERQ